MADINLTAGDDVYVQLEANRNDGNNIFGLAGNDTIRLYQGTFIGGAGNDRFERLVFATEPWRNPGAAYWNSPAGIVANLPEGWIDDGWGTRDTVVGITVVHGSGQDDRFIGDAADNFFYPNGGRDQLDGGAGNDGFDVREIPPNADGSGTWRPAKMDDLNIVVAPDGRSATVSVKYYPKITYTVVNMEYFRLIEANSTQYLLADFITPQSMAEQAIAAGGAMRWNSAASMGSAVSVSYSFVTNAPTSGVGANGFRAFTPTEQQLVRDILAKTAALANISFNEVSESGATVGQLRFGASQQTATKGQAYLPGQNGDQAGDVWMDLESMVGMAVGSEGYQALLHEIGHALGLRHPRNLDVGDAWAVQLREQDDRSALTVMSETPSADGLFRADWGPLDVLALRYLYGSKLSNSADTTYMLGARESAAQTTIVDDAGIDTLNASGLPTGVSLDLMPGHLGSAGITAAGFSGVDNLGLAATSLIENAVGSAFDDVLLGNDLSNLLTGGLGNDWIDGGKGIDAAIFAGRRSDYEISNAFGKIFVEARDGVAGFDTLISIEQLRFADQTLVLSAAALGGDVNLSVDEDARLASNLPDPVDMARGAVSWRLLGAPAHGSASLSATGALSYSPAADFWGRDEVNFEISGAGGANRYIAYVQVLPINDGPPVARNAGLLSLGSNPLKASLPKATDIDGDSIVYSLAAEAKNGEALVSSNGALAYRAKAGYSGTDTFSYTVSDGMGGSNTYTVSLSVAAVAQLREGSEGADVLGAQTSGDGYSAYGGADRITGGAGNDAIDGGDGIDTAIYQGIRNLFLLTKTDYGWAVNDGSGAEGNDRITSVERLKFANTSLALDMDGYAGAVAQIIRAVFGKSFLSNKDFVGIGLQLFDGGMSYADVVSLALRTDLFKSLAGSASNAAFVNLVYKNVVGILPSAGELTEFVGMLDSGAFTQASLGLLACQVSLNSASVELVGLASTGIEFVPQG